MFGKFLFASRDHNAYTNGQAFMSATKHRSSCAEVLYAKDFHKNSAKSTKTSMAELLFNKVACLQPANLL